MLIGTKDLGLYFALNENFNKQKYSSIYPTYINKYRKDGIKYPFI